MSEVPLYSLDRGGVVPRGSQRARPAPAPLALTVLYVLALTVLFDYLDCLICAGLDCPAVLTVLYLALTALYVP